MSASEGFSAWIEPSVLKDIEAIKKSLSKVQKSVAGKVLRKGMREGLKLIAQKAAAEAPVKTGRLRRAMKVMAMKRKAGRIGFTLMPKRKYLKIADGSEHYYPAYQEYGTPKMKGKHFMKRAYLSGANSARDTALRLIKQGLDEAVRNPS